MVDIGMNRYQNGQIYKITDVGFNKCYVGSTCENLSKRMERHRVCYKSFLKGTSGRMRSFDLFEEFGVENCKIWWIEDYPCENRKQLEAREGFYIERLDCVNRCHLGRTRSEYARMYREQNPEKVKEAKRTIYYHNPQKTIDATKKWQQENPEKVKTNARKYRENNREKEQIRKKTYYEKYKDEINERLSQKVECVCGVICRKDGISRHLKTKCHQQWIEQQQQKDNLVSK